MKVSRFVWRTEISPPVYANFSVTMTPPPPPKSVCSSWTLRKNKYSERHGRLLEWHSSIVCLWVPHTRTAPILATSSSHHHLLGWGVTENNGASVFHEVNSKKHFTYSAESNYFSTDLHRIKWMLFFKRLCFSVTLRHSSTLRWASLLTALEVTSCNIHFDVAASNFSHAQRISYCIYSLCSSLRSWKASDNLLRTASRTPRRRHLPGKSMCTCVYTDKWQMFRLSGSCI